MGVIVAVCTSDGKGTPKKVKPSGILIAQHGLEGDGHAGDWHRQVSILCLEQVEEFRRRGAQVDFGDFGENLIVSELLLDGAKPGDRLLCGEAILEITQIGKECHSHCKIFESMGDCIMPRHGVFARVLRGGMVKAGTEITFAVEVPGAVKRLHIANASPSWRLVMQSGVGLPCMVGLPVSDILSRQFAIPAEALAKIDAVLIDGMPVDDIDTAIVGNGSRLALAAGLPGIVGLAMKRGSAVRALRGGITHRPVGDSQPVPGRVMLFLYSLTIHQLGGFFLSHGVEIGLEQLRRYAGFSPVDIAEFENRKAPIGEFLANGAFDREQSLLLSADIRAGTEGECHPMLD